MRRYRPKKGGLPVLKPCLSEGRFVEEADQASGFDLYGFDPAKKVSAPSAISSLTRPALLGASVLRADVRARDGALDLLFCVRRRFPFIECIFVDAGYRGP